MLTSTANPTPTATAHAESQPIAEPVRRFHTRQTRLERRRLNFFRAERFSQSEISFFPSTFDPGPEYD